MNAEMKERDIYCKQSECNQIRPKENGGRFKCKSDIQTMLPEIEPIVYEVITIADYITNSHLLFLNFCINLLRSLLPSSSLLRPLSIGKILVLEFLRRLKTMIISEASKRPPDLTII